MYSWIRWLNHTIWLWRSSDMYLSWMVLGYFLHDPLQIWHCLWQVTRIYCTLVFQAIHPWWGVNKLVLLISQGKEGDISGSLSCHLYHPPCITHAQAYAQTCTLALIKLKDPTIIKSSWVVLGTHCQNNCPGKRPSIENVIICVAGDYLRHQRNAFHVTPRCWMRIPPRSGFSQRREWTIPTADGRHVNASQCRTLWHVGSSTKISVPLERHFCFVWFLAAFFCPTELHGDYSIRFITGYYYYYYGSSLPLNVFVRRRV